jgi:hypothetical protein
MVVKLKEQSPIGIRQLVVTQDIIRLSYPIKIHSAVRRSFLISMFHACPFKPS